MVSRGLGDRALRVDFLREFAYVKRGPEKDPRGRGDALMPRKTRKSFHAVGLPPGTLVHVGEKVQERTKITWMEYDERDVRESVPEDLPDGLPGALPTAVTWINVDGIHDVGLVERIGNRYGLHPLVLEDILNTTERPKMEDFGDYLFLVLKLFSGNRDGGARMRQISLILGTDFVLTFQEEESAAFEGIRERIRKGRGRIRKSGADYLAYALIDAAVDGMFGVLEKMGEDLESIEERLIDEPERGILVEIHGFKREMIDLRKSVWPLREVVNGLIRLETPLVKDTTEIFLRDVYDHTVQIIENIETYRDILSGMLETHLSSLSNRMNEVMKVLTIIATIFIPLTFIAGLYGMNFAVMPELNWRWGYPASLVLMGCVAGFMLLFFKRKKWL